MDVAHFILQVAVVLLAAKSLGHVFSRYLKQPRVLGELFAGMLIGPYALGGIPIPYLGHLFPPLDELLPVSSELHSLAILGSVVLLFTAGLETDLEKFLRYSAAGLSVAVGGAVLPFLMALGVTVWFGQAQGLGSPAALMMATATVATSVGLTVAVLSEMRRMDTPEGATILSAAVIDDVIGLVVLAMVLNLVASDPGGSPTRPWVRLLMVVVKAGFFWALLMAVAIFATRPVGRFIKSFGGPGAVATVGLALALLLAALAEKVGLALIIGAYTMGLALSRLDMTYELQRRMAPIRELLVPIFFCVMGMMVDFRRLPGVFAFGAAYTVVAMAGKLAGCGFGAYALGFNLKGAFRVGAGMCPRQEVALVVAAVGLASGAIDAELYGAAVMMTFVITVVSPPLLARLFRGGSGLRREEREPARLAARLEVTLPGPELAELVAERMARAFQQEEFYVHRREGANLYEMLKDRISVFLRVSDSTLEFSTHPDHLQYVRFVILEEMIALSDVFREASQFAGMDHLKRTLLGHEDRPAHGPEEAEG